MRTWKPITDEQKNGDMLLLGIPDKKIGPWMGRFSLRQNCWLAGNPDHGHYPPTHYDTLDGLFFK